MMLQRLSLSAGLAWQGQIPSTLRKNSKGAAFLSFKAENRYTACPSTVFAKPAILEVNLGLI